MIPDKKRCETCAKVKELYEFSKNSRTVDGRRNECTECRNKKRRVIREADYDALFVNQGGLCAICGIDANTYGKRFSVDHDHEDDTARALLCLYCNTIIGMADEDTSILESAIGYLKHHRTRIIQGEMWKETRS